MNMSNLPSWFSEIFNIEKLNYWDISKNILRPVSSDSKMSVAQTQTAESFGYQWSRRDLFDQANAQTQVKGWLVERFGAPDLWLKKNAILLDAGCGGGAVYFGLPW